MTDKIQLLFTVLMKCLLDKLSVCIVRNYLLLFRVLLIYLLIDFVIVKF